MTRRILVYTPDPGEGRAYADLIRLPSRAFTVHVAETPEQAVGPAAEAEILYGWRPPRGLLGAAKRLRWIQGMGAGVEQLLVPEVAPTVRITTAVYGVHLPGTAYRMDEVPIPLRAVLPASYPSDAEVLAAIERRLFE